MTNVILPTRTWTTTAADAAATAVGASDDDVDREPGWLDRRVTHPPRPHLR